MMRFPFAFLVLSLAARAIGADGDAFFREKVRPILADQCFKCHSHEANKIKGGLVLDSRDGLLAGGDSGPSAVPGDPEKSLLIKAVRYEDEDLRMPPNKGDGKKLPDASIAILAEWIQMGAPWPEE
ncbi:MAG: c-type cytochrome domain-containing protein, partial [Chthoniobacteraceae bacterium]